MQTSNVENFVCSFIVKIGSKTLPTFSIVMGEATMSLVLGYGVILPSPIGIELMEFPARMMFMLRRRRPARFDQKGC